MDYYEKVFGGATPVEVLNRRGLEYLREETKDGRLFVFLRLKDELIRAGGLFYHHVYFEATKAFHVQFGHDYGVAGADGIYPYAVIFFSEIYSDSLNKIYDIREFRGGEILDWMFQESGYTYYEDGEHLFFEKESLIRLELLKKRR